MATSFSEPKLKAFPYRPRSPRLAAAMQSCAFILAANWCLQGMRGMDTKELGFRLTLELALALGLAPMLQPLLGSAGALAAGAVLAHSFNFTFNGQVWVCARYCRWYRRDPAALHAFLHQAASVLRRLPWLREALCIGSLGRSGTVRSDRSDLDLRLLFPPGLAGWLGVNLLLLGLRSWAFFGLIPLDLYAYERPERLRRFDQRERLMVLLDRDGRLAATYPRRAVHWP